MIKLNKGKFWLFFVLLLLFITGIVVQGFQITEEMRLGILVWQQFLFILGGLLGVKKLKIKKPRPKTLGWGLLAGVLLFSFNLLTGAITVKIATKLLSPTFVQRLLADERAGVASLLASTKPIIKQVIMFLLILGAPLAEELFFRGLLIDLWQEKVGAKQAVFYSALLFAVMHFYLLQFIPVLLAGLCLGFLFLRTEDLLVPILAHAVVNGLVLVSWLFT